MKDAFIMTGNGRVFCALMDAGFKPANVVPSKTGRIYVVFNSANAEVPKEYESECIYTSDMYLSQS